MLETLETVNPLDPFYRIMKHLDDCPHCSASVCPVYKSCTRWVDGDLTTKAAQGRLTGRELSRAMDTVRRFQGYRTGRLFTAPFAMVIALRSNPYFDVPLSLIACIVIVPMLALGTKWLVLKVVDARR